MISKHIKMNYIVAIVVKGYNGANKIENGSLTREIYKLEENIISI